VDKRSIFLSAIHLNSTFERGQGDTDHKREHAEQEICLESPCAGVGILVVLVENPSLPDNRKHPLLVSLGGACQSFERGHLNTGINQLQAFEHKVRAQVEKSDPALGRRLIAISALGGE
jgi:hypothetical protein